MSYPVSDRFWAASSAWYTSRKAAQAKSAKEGERPALDHKEMTWRSRGAKYLEGREDLAKWFKGGDGESFMVRTDPKLASDLLAFVREINPTVAAVFDDTLGKLAFDAWREWPVSSGLSKSLISLEYTIDGDRLVGTISNSTPYVFFIKGGPHRKLLEAPAGPAALRMAATIRDSLKLAAK